MFFRYYPYMGSTIILPDVHVYMNLCTNDYAEVTHQLRVNEHTDYTPCTYIYVHVHIHMYLSHEWYVPLQ